LKAFKQYIVICIFIFFWTSATGQVKTIDKDSLINYAKSYLGKPYKYGSSCEKAFDCSGFVSFVFRHFGISTPNSSKDYYRTGTSILLDSCKKGDIILFTGTNFSRKQVGHVGIIISNQGEPVFFIHSSSSKNHWGVTITDYNNSAYPKRFMGIKRIL